LVRVELHQGDLFEGRLYAVGKGRVWVDTKLGRMGIRAETIGNVERLVGAVVPGAVPVEAGMVGDRVRVRTPGGQFLYGKLGKVESDHVTIHTDEGARVRVPTTQVEPIAGKAKIRLNE
jgi:hypothetical protein